MRCHTLARTTEASPSCNDVPATNTATAKEIRESSAASQLLITGEFIRKFIQDMWEALSIPPLAHPWTAIQYRIIPGRESNVMEFCVFHSLSSSPFFPSHRFHTASTPLCKSL